MRNGSVAGISIAHGGAGMTANGTMSVTGTATIGDTDGIGIMIEIETAEIGIETMIERSAVSSIERERKV